MLTAEVAVRLPSRCGSYLRDADLDLVIRLLALGDTDLGLQVRLPVLLVDGAQAADVALAELLRADLQRAVGEPLESR